MNKYIKKPVVIQAVQFDGYNSEEIKAFCGDNCTIGFIDKVMIHTLEGNMIANTGDYIIKGIKGEFYPCKPDIFAVKCTAVRINGELKPIFKKPKTDDGTKNSLKGFILVTQENGQYVAHDEATEEQEKEGCLETVFKDGKLLKNYTLAEIRERVDKSLC